MSKDSTWYLLVTLVGTQQNESENLTLTYTLFFPSLKFLPGFSMVCVRGFLCELLSVFTLTGYFFIEWVMCYILSTIKRSGKPSARVKGRGKKGQ